jgi:hypothetical protein
MQDGGAVLVEENHALDHVAGKGEQHARFKGNGRAMQQVAEALVVHVFEDQKLGLEVHGDAQGGDDVGMAQLAASGEGEESG